MAARTSIRLAGLLLALALFGCGDESPENAGTPLVAPSEPYPPNGSDGQPISVELRWEPVVDDRSRIRFDLYFGESEDPPLLAHDLTRSYYRLAGLERVTTYHWRVVALALVSESAESPLWQFTTRDATAPPAPTDPDPPSGSGVALDRVALQWSAAGLPEDSLVYDLYFGLEADPPLVNEGLTDDSVEVAVAAWTTYHWRVVVRNADDASTAGPVWTFDALPVPGHMYNWAGTGTTGWGQVDQLPAETQLFYPQDVAFAPDGAPVVVDWNNHRVIGIDAATGRFRMIAGSPEGTVGDPCLPAPDPCEDVDAAEAPLNHPTHVTFAPDGRMILCAWHNSLVLRLDPGTGLMNRICGTGKQCFDGDEKEAATACIHFPAGSAFDAQGRLYFTDQDNMIVRMIDETGTIHLAAGTEPVWNGTKYVPQPGFSGDEGPATEARLRFSLAETCGKLCFAAGNLYIADTQNHCIRRVDAGGIIHRFAGLYPATPGYGGDGGPATAARLNQPRDVACDADGNVFIADAGNHAIRMVDPAGVISTVAGVPTVAGDSGQDGRLATESTLNLPYGIEIDGEGKLWIADTENSRIRVVYRRAGPPLAPMSAARSGPSARAPWRF